MDLAFVLNEFLRDILYAIRLLSKRRTENMDKAISIIKNTVSDYDTDSYPDYSIGLIFALFNINGGRKNAMNNKLFLYYTIWN